MTPRAIVGEREVVVAVAERRDGEAGHDAEDLNSPTSALASPTCGAGTRSGM